MQAKSFNSSKRNIQQAQEGAVMYDAGRYTSFAYYYDLLMKDVDYNKWCDYVLRSIEGLKIDHTDILEMACGTGAMSVLLSKKGYDVTAFDISEDMLAVASNKALDSGAKVNFLHQDMRDIKIHDRFGTILCLCDSMNYITDDNDLRKIFKWVFDHLKENGAFIFDINSSYKLKNIIGNNIFTYNEDDIVYIWENTLNDKCVEFSLTFFVKENKLYRRFDEFHIERIYEEEEIRALLKDAGFKYI
ncbi:MAG TPA: hypothetical protein DD426_02560, partial [Clostridiaceae bacterium]|nr:hypothetical protein [Clostridiaceae bacterium]